MHPVFMGQDEVVQRVLVPHHDFLPSFALGDLADSARFAADVNAFRQDLVATGHMDEDRATRLANVAVTEAYRRRVPPPLILGVMLTENDEFKSSARSSVGAVGLMQVYPRAWVPPLRKLFGSNLRDDAVNLRYGIYILGTYVHGEKDDVSPDSWRTALLHYNGCVRGTNTPRCHGYPDVVKRNVERSATAMCGTQDFDACVAKPLTKVLEHENAPRTIGAAE